MFRNEPIPNVIIAILFHRPLPEDAEIHVISIINRIRVITAMPLAMRLTIRTALVDTTIRPPQPPPQPPPTISR